MDKDPLRRLTPHHRTQLAPAFQALVRSRVIERLWTKDYQIWKPDPTEISNRLGWLDLSHDMQEQVDRLGRLAKTTRSAGVEDVVLLGMGGSSLGPEVLRSSFGARKGYPRLWVLDSTVPGWVQQVTASIHPSRTIFLVASKSGGTIEVMSLFAHFWALVANAKGGRGGEQFVAITDPGTSLEKLAENHRFSETFLNPPDIGGRYSVLSLFGLVPAALLGLDVRLLLERAREMANQCRQKEPLEANPGAALGTTMGVLVRSGRDKVTVIASPTLSTFGLWVEQLLAESTGKEGTGLIPVAQEPVLAPSAYGDDRLFVHIRLKGDKNAFLDSRINALVHSGQPVLQCELQDKYDLGGEFFRWEFATAVAGHLLGIHPFDQPNVQESKDNTNRVLEGFKVSGRLPEKVSISPKLAAKELSGQLRGGAYVAILAYAKPSRRLEAAIRQLRKVLVGRFHVTTTFGYGPRYLHSTGQLHKGGRNSGIFLELIDRMTPDVAIPGQSFSFGTLAEAQASGDLESLRAHDRYAIQVCLGTDPVSTVQAIAKALSPSAPRSGRTSPLSRRRKARHC